MNNAELIKALRNCSCIKNDDHCKTCGYRKSTECGRLIATDAADALESLSKAVIPHRNYENCHIYWCECGWFLRNKDQTPNYCPNCGKRIEWENAE